MADMTTPTASEEERIRAIEARANAATPGTWTTEKPGRDSTTGFARGVIVAATSPRQGIYSDPPGGSFPAADREFIAHSHQDIPWLIAELRAALAEISRLQGLLSKLQLNGRPNRKQRRAVLDAEGNGT